MLYLYICRGVAQLGSALLWGSRGREFESRRSDRLKPLVMGGFAILKGGSHG